MCSLPSDSSPPQVENLYPEKGWKHVREHILLRFRLCTFRRPNFEEV